MMMVHRYEDVFYGAGIMKTHLVDEFKNRNITLCGQRWSVWGGQQGQSSVLEPLRLSWVDCKKCLKRLKS